MKLLKRIFFTLVCLGIVGFLFSDSLLELAREPINHYLKDFPESKYLTSEAPSSYPSMACHNSHAEFGERVRVTQNLDGVWTAAQGEMTDTLPRQFDHSVSVPGFLSEATPQFAAVGIESDEREAFWYRKTFVAPSSPSTVAVLCLHKAKYGAKAWLNGQPLGEHSGAFTLSEYNLTSAIRFGEENELIVRVGATPAALPEFVPIGADLEKYAYYPGLWDSVSVVYTGAVSIVRTKVEPDIDRQEVVVRTTLRNHQDFEAKITLAHKITPWTESPSNNGAGGDGISKPVVGVLTIPANQTVTHVNRLPLVNARLWSPENPYLYRAMVTVTHNGQPSDDRAIRFGMRKVEWRLASGESSLGDAYKAAPGKKGFYLNNRLYYLRGTNIALHRFFEDQQRGRLPWQEQWVRQLLSGHMKDFHWNSFRFHIGRAPNAWYDLADEIGFIVADEYHIFSPMRLGIPGMPSSNNWSHTEVQKEFAGWIRENWNHASIGWWDASNENHNPIPYDVVPLVRHLDETRAWESGSYRAADRPTDPLEDHPYKLNGTSFMNSNPRDYRLEDFDTFDRNPPGSVGIVFATWDGEGARNHPYINNEYAWLWLTRDGSDATPIAEVAYNLLAPDVDLSAEERRELYAYAASEISGYWRASEGYSGTQHFLYLGKCTDKDDIEEGADINQPSATCDNFTDIPTLTMEPRWARWAPQAFSPVAVNIDKWSADFYQPGEGNIPLTLSNDTQENKVVTVKLTAADSQGNILAQSTSDHRIPATGKLQAQPSLILPQAKEWVLYASVAGDFAGSPAYSRRKIGMAHPGVIVQLPPGILRDINGD